MPKILHTVSVAFSLKYFIGNQFDYFRKKGYDISVACSDSKELRNYSYEKKFKIFPVPIVRKISLVQDLVSCYKLYNFINKERFDIVVGHSPKGALLSMIASFLVGTKHRVFFRHGLVFETETGLKKILLVWIEKLTSKLSTIIINVSPSLKEHSLRLNLDDTNKSFVLGKGSCNGIDLQKFKKDEDIKKRCKIVVGFVGRLCVDKGVVELIRAWQLLKLSNKNKNLELLLVGPLDEREPLPETFLQSIRKDDSINWVGDVLDTSKYYKLMDIFILPSHREGFGMVNLEAAANSLPVITTRIVGAVDSIVENVTGLFVENSIDSIQEKLQFYIDNPAIRINHGENGRILVEEFFSEEVKFKELEKLIYNIHS